MRNNDNSENIIMKKKVSYHHGDLRAALLISAEAEISEKGIEAFSLRSVAKRAGVSHAAPTHHFGDAQGLLTALSADGYIRFVAMQEHRQKQALPDPRAQMVASGLGYIDFATENPALFRLMFSSKKPDNTNETLAVNSAVAFEKLVEDMSKIENSDPHTEPKAMTDVMATWAIVHGIADLLIGGSSSFIEFLDSMDKTEREATLTNIILRACP